LLRLCRLDRSQPSGPDKRQKPADALKIIHALYDSRHPCCFFGRSRNLEIRPHERARTFLNQFRGFGFR